MRILFALPGLHNIDRGAEVAFISIAGELAKLGHDVVLAGSGRAREGTSYEFIHIPSISRSHFERFPLLPLFRDVTAYEELTYLPGLLWRFVPSAYDITVACSYPFTNWALRRPVLGGARPPHVFVTENGDWPARTTDAEYRLFGCEGLVCINPDFYNSNKDRWFSALIPNGVNIEKFKAGKLKRERFGLPAERIIVLMVSALIPSKRVDVAIEVVSRVPNAHLVVAGDGPMRASILASAQRLLPDRFTKLTLNAQEMPDLYASVDLFLHMSLEESFGNVFLEAMASGLPIIAHDSPRLRWIIGDKGELLNTHNIDEVVGGITRASSPSLVRREALRAAASKFDWSKIAIEYEQFFHQVINRSNSRNRLDLTPGNTS